MTTFPDGFLWGVSTAAYQIEGAARIGGRGPSIWDIFSHKSGRIVGGGTGDAAAEHWRHFREDLALARALGVTAYRFSLSWPRLLPTGRGRSHQEGLDFYNKLVDAILDADLEPWLCLYHWDLPQSLEDKGGWTNRDVAHWFGDYANRAAGRFADRVRNFITLANPNVACVMGYGLGRHAPGRASEADFLSAVHHMNLGHGYAVEALRAVDANLHIGTVLNMQPVKPVAAKDEDAAARADMLWNRSFADPIYVGEYPDELAEMLAKYIEDDDLEQIDQPVEFLGVSHYGPLHAAAKKDGLLGFDLVSPKSAPERSPEDFLQSLLTVKDRYGHMPAFVLENGYIGPAKQGKDDAARIDYFRDYLGALAEAVEQGVDIRGYFAWALLDGFEWLDGYEKRAGLVHVDFASQMRQPKKSFGWLQEVIDRNALPG